MEASDAHEPGHLYKLLGVDPDATDDQIKRAYRKMAIRFHPDKNPGHEEKFHEIAAAFEILSDPDKRDIYDKMGMDGVKMLDMLGDKNVLRVMEHALVAVCGFLTIVTLLILQTVFLCLKLSAKVNWHWAIVLIPLLIIEGIILFLFLSAEFMAEDESKKPEDGDATHDDSEIGEPRPFFTVVKELLASMTFWMLLCACCFTVLLAIHLDSPSKVPIEGVFAVVFVMEALMFINAVLNMCCVRRKRSRARRSSRDKPDVENPSSGPDSGSRSRTGPTNTGQSSSTPSYTSPPTNNNNSHQTASDSYQSAPDPSPSRPGPTSPGTGTTAGHSHKEDDDDDVEDVDFDGVEREPSNRFAGCCGASLMGSVRLTLEVLILLKLTGDLKADWAVVFIPAFVYLALHCLRLLGMCLTAPMEERRAAMAMCCFGVCWIAAAITTLALLATSHDSSTHYDSVAIISPLITLFGIFFGLPCCCLCCLCVLGPLTGRGAPGSSGESKTQFPPLLLMPAPK